LVLLDDLHAADAESIEAIRYLANAAIDGVVVVGALRSGEAALPDELARSLRRDGLAEIIELAPLGERAVSDLVAALLDADVPAGPVNSVSEALAMMQDVDGDAWLQEAGVTRLAPSPIRIHGERLPVRLAPPRLGEHTDQVLTEAGLEAAEIAALRASGAVT